MNARSNREAIERIDTMKAIPFAVCILAAASVATAPLVMADEPPTPAKKGKLTESDKPPAIPATPAAVADLVYARTFTLEKGFKFFWCKEKPNVTTGALLVLKVDKALVIPRAMPMPVLYVGDRTAQPINSGHKSGWVIAIVPGKVDLTRQPIWFGTPDLPSRVDAKKAKSERALADKAGIKPFSKEKVKAAQAKGGEQLTLTDMSALLRGVVASLIEEYSPDEKNLADDFRRPVIKRPKLKKLADDEE